MQTTDRRAASAVRDIDTDYMHYLDEMTVEMVRKHEKPSVINAIRKIYLEWYNRCKEAYGEN